eukprot:CAMPEP_0172822934 /NCGR_PEP_ID=MMETSP1075-20121228/16980_1 /TAXON_ID=2916 /ORGANISM="Ceratium fusus, Strain PA161109" /LENGTH=55 /DNA_ID=CAMNT_0013663983 /DNA_START=301 /DNA_END=466 /DNA_ORIENTATION=-
MTDGVTAKRNHMMPVGVDCPHGKTLITWQDFTNNLYTECAVQRTPFKLIVSNNSK